MIKYILASVFILLNLSAFSATSNFSWQPTHNTDNGILPTISYARDNPQIAYAATAGGGIFKSTDGGMHWIPTSKEGLGDLYIAQIVALNSETVFAVSATGTYRSDDAGMHWRRINYYSLGPIAYKASEGFAYHPHAISVVDANLLFSVGNFGELFSSTDSGQSWQQIPIIIDENRVLISEITALDNQHLFATAWTSGMVKSDDGGKTWTFINNGLTIESGYAAIMDYKVINDKLLLAVTSRKGLLKTVDGGLHWTPINSGLPIHKDLPSLRYVALYARDAMNYMISSDGALYQTSDGGQQWMKISSNFPHEGILSISSITPEQLLITTNGMGIYNSNDNGQTWAHVTGITAAYVTALHLIDDQNIFAGLQGGGLVKTTDGGKSWASLNNGLTNLNVNAIATTEGQTIYAGTDNGLFKSTDAGLHFTAMNAGLDNVYIHSLLIVDSSLMFAGTGNGLYKSTDAGHHWQVVLFSPYCLVSTAPIETISYSNNVLTITLGRRWPYGAIFRSTDTGDTWYKDGEGLIYDMYVEYPVLSRVFDQTQYMVLGNKIYAQDKISSYWSDITGNLPKNYHLTGIVVSKPYIFVSAEDFAAYDGKKQSIHTMGVYSSKDGGNSWSPVNDGLRSLGINRLKISGNTLFAATEGAGIYTLRLQ